MKARPKLLNQARDWKRAEAEKRIHELLDGAKSGQLQRISDNDGVFEISFASNSKKPRIGDVLARGGPEEDED